MKKIIGFILLVVGLLIFPKNVFASGGITISPTSLTIEEGSSKTFTITATNTIGDVNSISSSNSSVASVSAGSWGTGMIGPGETRSTTITVTGNSEGTATITLNLNAATFDEESITGQRTVSVTVTKKQTQPEPQEPTTVVVKPSNNNNNNNNNKTETKTETKSSNKKVKEISIEGYKLNKVDDNNYTLSVENEVDKIKVKVVAEDTKATISGDGEKELEVGENKIEITITAEDGSTNKITIKVTRKEEEVVVEPIIETDDDVETPEPKNKINIISIIMIALNVILAISVIVLYRKNKKLKESINK